MIIEGYAFKNSFETAQNSWKQIQQNKDLKENSMVNIDYTIKLQIPMKYLLMKTGQILKSIL